MHRRAPAKIGDESLTLDRQQLVNALTALRAPRTLAALREAIGDLNKLLADPHSFLRAESNDDSAVLFTEAHLIGELEQISASQTIERARYYLERLIKSTTEERFGPVNDINLNRWKEYEDIFLDSLWQIDRRENTGVHAAGYWGNFIPQIPYQMMRRYTKRGEWVLDCFAGSGTTLIEAQRLGRNCLGIELQEAVAERARELLAMEPNDGGAIIELHTGDSTTADYLELLAGHGQRSVQLVMMHPPYFDIIKFSEDPRDLSNAASVDEFLDMMDRVLDRVLGILDPGRYLALVIGDKYSSGEWIPLGFNAMSAALKRGFTLKSIVVKNFEQTTAKRQQRELWRYRALAGGFYLFKHEYIFILRKPD